MSKVHSIPTVYNGYKCRSLAEARWMKLLDKAGVQYAYESEGFQLSDGTKYLPDFYLPRQDCFFEVKGVMDDKDLHKIRQLAIDSGKEVFVGYPDFSMELYSVNGERELEDTGPLPAEPESDIFICECKQCWGVYLKSKVGDWTCPICGYYDGDNGFHIVYDTTYPRGDAYEAAKSMSFEGDPRQAQDDDADLLDQLKEDLKRERSRIEFDQDEIDSAFADNSIIKYLSVETAHVGWLRRALEQVIRNGYWQILTINGEMRSMPKVCFEKPGKRGRRKKVINPVGIIKHGFIYKGRTYIVLSKSLETHLDEIYKMVCNIDGFLKRERKVTL